MRRAVLSLVAFFLVGLALQANDEKKAADQKPAPQITNVDRLKANPDDFKALSAYLGEMESRIKFLVDQGDAPAAEKKLKEMNKLLDSLKPATAEAKQLLHSTERLLASLESDVKLARTPLAELEAAVDAKPNDRNALNKYTSKVFRTAYWVMRSDPDQAAAGIRACRERLAKLRVSANDSLKKQLDQMESFLADYDKRIAASRELLALIGSDAMPLQVEAWINGTPLKDADLKGKVVLLDFGAVWCGPCIRQFPQLRAWHEKYASKGLVIVGVTDYFNFTWDAALDRAVKSESEVAPEQERAMLRKFVAQHDLPYRFGIQAGLRSLDSAMAKHYKVTGFPHVVVIDQAGKVRLLRSGADPLNSKDIGDLLEKLLGAAPARQPKGTAADDRS